MLFPFVVLPSVAPVGFASSTSIVWGPSVGVIAGSGGSLAVDSALTTMRDGGACLAGGGHLVG